MVKYISPKTNVKQIQYSKSRPYSKNFLRTFKIRPKCSKSQLTILYSGSVTIRRIN